MTQSPLNWFHAQLETHARMGQCTVILGITHEVSEAKLQMPEVR